MLFWYVHDVLYMYMYYIRHARVIVSKIIATNRRRQSILSLPVSVIGGGGLTGESPHTLDPRCQKSILNFAIL